MSFFVDNGDSDNTKSDPYSCLSDNGMDNGKLGTPRCSEC